MSTNRLCICRCSRCTLPLPAWARAVRPLAAGEAKLRVHQAHPATACLGCPSVGGQRAARWVS